MYAVFSVNPYSGKMRRVGAWMASPHAALNFRDSMRRRTLIVGLLSESYLACDESGKVIG